MTHHSRIGDLLRAVGGLGAQDNPREREAIAAMLGVSLATRAPVEPGEFQNAMRSAKRVTSPASLSSSVRKPFEIPTTTPGTLQRVGARGGTTTPDWISQAELLPFSSTRVLPDKPSLFGPQWVRAILTRTLGTPEESTDVDVSRLVDDLVSQRPVRRIPLRRIRSLARGVYCWIDHSTAMEPFLADQADMVQQLRSAVGDLRVTVLPTNGVPASSLELAQGVPHLLLSDLGLRSTLYTRGVRLQLEWAKWARHMARQHDTRIMAFVPGSVEAYRRELRGTCILLRWDRDTSVQDAHRVLLNARA